MVLNMVEYCEIVVLSLLSHLDLIHSARCRECTKWRSYVSKHIWYILNTCTYTINFLPCPSGLSTAQCTNCSNQVLLCYHFLVDRDVHKPLCMFHQNFFAAVLFYYTAVGTCSHRLLFIFLMPQRLWKMLERKHGTLTLWPLRVTNI